MLTLYATLRKNTGKSFSRKLRKNDKIPGILYGMNQMNILLILDHNSIFNLQKKVEFYKENLLLIIEEKKCIVKVHAIQKHSFKLKLLHIDFLYVNV